MTEFLSREELPAVSGSDPAVIEKLTVLVGKVVDFDLPGFGIYHTDESATSTLTVHESHQRYILDAIRQAVPAIRSNDSFDDYSRLSFNWGTPIHTDLECHLEPAEGRGLEMMLRLHTTDNSNGADVRFVHTGPGLLGPVGDSGLFDNSFQSRSLLRSYGYDESSYLIQPEDRLRFLDEGGYDPIVAEPRIYDFDQKGLASVVFRTMSALGPLTAHSFTPHDTSKPRNIVFSDLVLRAY